MAQLMVAKAALLPGSEPWKLCILVEEVFSTMDQQSYASRLRALTPSKKNK
jgi:hypothetical protein